METGLKDMFNKNIEFGHIVAVRYCWNSYAGVIRPKGLSLGEFAERFLGAALFHQLDDKATYQILGHIEKSHTDFNPEILKWIKSETGECPIKIKVYSNMPKV